MPNSDQIGGIVRAILAAVGGYLVSKGLVSADTVAQISGAVVTIAVAIWSYYTNQSGKTIA